MFRCPILNDRSIEARRGDQRLKRVSSFSFIGAADVCRWPLYLIFYAASEHPAWLPNYDKKDGKWHRADAAPGSAQSSILSMPIRSASGRARAVGGTPIPLHSSLFQSQEALMKTMAFQEIELRNL
jgi:hypothetical protein